MARARRFTGSGTTIRLPWRGIGPQGYLSGLSRLTYDRVG
jgi:hypothetical protein